MKEIYLVEDDESIRELIEYLLISADYKVKAFATAELFNTSISNHNPDLVVMDVMLPDGNGLEICRSLAENEDKKHIPVVLMSAHTSIAISKESCAKDFISKPFDVEEFLAKVGKQLN